MAGGTSRTGRLIQNLWFPATVGVLWEWAAAQGWLNPFFFPPPSKILATGWTMVVGGEVARILGVTLGRFTVGASLGSLAGVACGALMGISGTARRALEPMIAGLYATPKLALLPLFFLLMGLGEAPKITLIALVGFIFLSTQTLDAIRGVKPSYVEMARNYGAGRRALLRRVYLPAALPQIFTGLRIAVSRSLVVAISLELVSGTNGLGGLIWISWETLATERLYVGILLAAGLGVVIHRGFGVMETRLVPWRS